MGAGLPAGIVAKMLNPERNVIAVVGDGGFLMNSQELETAVRHNVAVVVLVLNDNGFGFIRWKQQNMGFRRFGMDYSNPDFAQYAKAYGAVGMKVNEGDSLSEVLRAALLQRKPVLVECPIDYSVNYEAFSLELEHLVCEI